MVSAGVYRSPAAVYVQVMPQLEKALTSDPKVSIIDAHLHILVSGIARPGSTQLQWSQSSLISSKLRSEYTKASKSVAIVIITETLHGAPNCTLINLS